MKRALREGFYATLSCQLVKPAERTATGRWRFVSGRVPLNGALVTLNRIEANDVARLAYLNNLRYRVLQHRGAGVPEVPKSKSDPYIRNNPIMRLPEHLLSVSLLIETLLGTDTKPALSRFSISTSVGRCASPFLNYPIRQDVRYLTESYI